MKRLIMALCIVAISLPVLAASTPAAEAQSTRTIRVTFYADENGDGMRQGSEDRTHATDQDFKFFIRTIDKYTGVVTDHSWYTFSYKAHDADQRMYWQMPIDENLFSIHRISASDPDCYQYDWDAQPANAGQRVVVKTEQGYNADVYNALIYCSDGFTGE